MLLRIGSVARLVPSGLSDFDRKRNTCSSHAQLKIVAEGRRSDPNPRSNNRSRKGASIENKKRRRGRPAWTRKPDDTPFRDGNRDRLVGLLTERAARTLCYYLSETNLNVHHWLMSYMQRNPIPRSGGWDDVSGENFLRKLLSMPLDHAKWSTGRDPLYDNGVIPGCGVDPRNLAQRIMAIRSQLSLEFIEDLRDVSEENSTLLRESLVTSLSMSFDDLPVAEKDSQAVAVEDSQPVAEQDSLPVAGKGFFPAPVKRSAPVTGRGPPPGVVKRSLPVAGKGFFPAAPKPSSPVAGRGPPPVAEQRSALTAENGFPPVAEKNSPVAEKKSPAVVQKHPQSVAKRSVAEKKSPPVLEISLPMAEKDSPSVAGEDTPPAAEKGSLPVAEMESPPVAGKNSPPVVEKDSLPVAEKDSLPVAEMESLPVADKKSLPVADKKSPPLAVKDFSPVAENVSLPVAGKDTSVSANSSDSFSA